MRAHNAPVKYDVLVVGGFGHVGLPLGIVIADAGLNVMLYDINASMNDTILSGTMPFVDEGAEPLLRKVIGKTLHVTNDIAEVKNSEIIVVTIGTPLDEYLNPKLMPVLDLFKSLLPLLTDEHLLILRSTVYPGTMDQLHNFLQKNEKYCDISYCSERIIQGCAVRELMTLPQVIAGFTESAIKRASALFERIGSEPIVVGMREAEFTKLFLNAWRYIQFATANQFFVIAQQDGADFEEIYHAMTHKYDRAKDFAKAGFAAGPCLLKDTMQLAAFAPNNFPLGHDSMLINEGLPQFIVDQLSQERDLTQEVVGVLGMAFKGDNDDPRDSLSYKLAKILRFRGANVFCSDEFIKDPSFVLKEELCEKCSIIILATPHSAYNNLHIPEHVHLVDIWGFFPKGPRKQKPKRIVKKMLEQIKKKEEIQSASS
ncbi:MAG: nucleotide sugar dehydrogenase [Patescibacteria group bacterium]